MPLHPQAQAFLADLESQGALDDSSVGATFDEVRAAARAEALAQSDKVGLDAVEDRDADGVPVRLYRPRLGAPVALYVHGGGWVMHDLETHDAFCRYLAHATGWALLAVDYRLAPENPYPAPLDDVETVARWVRAGNLESLRVDSGFLPAIGDSAGANLIAGLSARAPELLDTSVLIYPATDRQAVLDPGLSNAGLDDSGMAEYWRLYAGDADNAEISPVRSERLSEFSRTLLVTAEYDVLAAQGREFAAALASAGVDVTSWQIDGVVHSFWRQPWAFDASKSLVIAVGALLDSWRSQSARLPY